MRRMTLKMVLALVAVFAIGWTSSGFALENDGIYFANRANGPWAIERINPMTGERDTLCEPGGTRVWGGALSPDRTKFVFCSDMDGSNEQYDLYWINADGSGDMNRITFDGGIKNNPSWVDDSALIFSNSYQIERVNLDGSGRECLTCSLSGSFAVPTLSPDRSQIVYTNGYEMYLADFPDFDNVCALPSPGPLYHMAKDWHDDDIAFYTTDDHGIYLTQGCGSGVDLLSPPGTIDVSPFFSADGEWIAFGSYVGGQHGTGNLWIMKSDGDPTSRSQLTFVSPTKSIEILDWRGTMDQTSSGIIHGFVSTDDEPAIGVPVDVYDAAGVVLFSTSTDDTGYYCTDTLDGGDYSVSISTPLGYVADEETKYVTVSGGVTQVDFELSELDFAPQQRSRGYWAHQLHRALWGWPKDYSVDDFADFAGLINLHFNQNQMNSVDFYSVPQPATQHDSLQILKDLLHMRNTDGCEPILKRIAKAQLMALMLNVVSGKIHQTCEIADDGRTISQLITYSDLLIGDEIDPPDDMNYPGYGSPWFRYIYASFVLVKANLGLTIPSGMIPENVIHIAYKTESNVFVPVDCDLGQNYPNPFNPTTRISFSIPEAGKVKLDIYNILGQNVATLVDEYRQAGTHEVTWNASGVASGVYFYRLTAGEFTATKRMLLLK